MAYTKAKLMRLVKEKLLFIASDIFFVNEENTKSEIADAILIMAIQDPADAPVPDPSEVNTVDGGPRQLNEDGQPIEAFHPSTDHPDYPKSERVKRASGEL